MPRKNQAKQLFGVVKDLAATAKSLNATVNTIKNNGLSTKSAKAIYDEGKSGMGLYNKYRHRGRGGRGRRRIARQPRAKPNPVAKGILTTKRALLNEQGTSHRRRHVVSTKALHGLGNYTLQRATNACRIEHTELITTIYATGGQITPQFYPLTPSSARLNPFAANLARQYAKVRVQRMVITYQGTSGTDANGKLWMCADFRTNDFTAAPYSQIDGFAQASNQPVDGGCPVWSTCAFSIDVRSFSKGTDRVLTTYNGNIQVGMPDMEQYCGGFLCVMTTATGTDALGTLSISYVYEFFEAKLPTPVSDFYVLNGWSVDDGYDNITGSLYNVSNSPITVVAYADDINRNIIQVQQSVNLTVELRMTGQQFQVSPTNTTMNFSLGIVTGSTGSLYNVVGTAEAQTATFSLQLGEGGSFYLIPTAATSVQGFVLNVMQMSIYITAVNVSSSQNLSSTPPKVIARPKAQFSFKFYADAMRYFEQTGKPYPAVSTISMLKNRCTPYYLTDHDLRQLDAESQEKVCSSHTLLGTVGECKEDDIDDDDVTVCSEPVKLRSGKQQNNWISSDLTHRGMHAKNGNGWLLLFLLATVEGQAWPFVTTTKIPTPPPFTTLSPTHAIPHLERCTFATLSGAASEPFNSWDEYCALPVLTKYDANNLHYSGLYGYPANITIVFRFGAVTNGYGKFRAVAPGGGYLNGTTLVQNGVQLSFVFWHIPNNQSREIQFEPPVGGSSSTGFIYSSNIANHPYYDQHPTLSPTSAILF